MNRKPDIIRTILLVFAVGLVITGFTSMQSPDGGFSTAASAFVTEASPAATEAPAATDEFRRN